MKLFGAILPTHARLIEAAAASTGTVHPDHAGEEDAPISPEYTVPRLASASGQPGPDNSNGVASLSPGLPAYQPATLGHAPAESPKPEWIPSSRADFGHCLITASYSMDDDNGRHESARFTEETLRSAILAILADAQWSFIKSVSDITLTEENCYIAQLTLTFRGWIGSKCIRPYLEISVGVGVDIDSDTHENLDLVLTPYAQRLLALFTDALAKHGITLT